MNAQLVRPKRFNAIECVAMPIYLLEYFGKKERSVYLSVNDDGSLRETGNALEVSRYQRGKELPLRVKLAWVVGVLAAIWLLTS